MLMSCMELQRLALSLHSKEVAGSTPLGQGLFLVCLRVLSMSAGVLSGYPDFLPVGDWKLNSGMTGSVCLSICYPCGELMRSQG